MRFTFGVVSDDAGSSGSEVQARGQFASAAGGSDWCCANAGKCVRFHGQHICEAAGLYAVVAGLTAAQTREQR